MPGQDGGRSLWFLMLQLNLMVQVYILCKLERLQINFLSLCVIIQIYNLNHQIDIN